MYYVITYYVQLYIFYWFSWNIKGVYQLKRKTETRYYKSLLLHMFSHSVWNTYGFENWQLNLTNVHLNTEEMQFS